MVQDDDSRIRYLIDYITNEMPYSVEGETLIYEELLQCSIRSENLYGQAFAYINFSRVYQETQQEEYTKCIKKAYEIAEKENYIDILLRYYNLEGIRYMENGDEANALTIYLKGMHSAMSILDHRLCAVFYNNIAEIFYENQNYDQAILYYLKALKTLELVTDYDPKRYRKAFIENLISSYCYKKDLENAKKYLQEYKMIVCEDRIRPFAEEEAEIRVLLLEQKREEAVEHAFALLDAVKAATVDDEVLFYVYSFLFDVFLRFKNQEKVLFCLFKLKQMKMKFSQKHAIETQKRKIYYYQTFNIKSNSVFKEFYELTLEFEQNNTQAISNSLSASVSLFEIQKEKRMIKKEREYLKEFIRYDPLTTIYNRRTFDQIVNDYLQEKSVKSISYVMIDIDYFKEYNDYYGHYQGDLVLKSVSALIKDALPEQAYAARYGGDEFACVLINKSVQEVGQFMQRIQSGLTQEKIQHGKAKRGNCLTLSLGAYYTSDLQNVTMDVLIKKADDALYQVKNNGRNGRQIVCEDAAMLH